MANKDPLELGALEPARIDVEIEKKKKPKPMSEAEIQREERLLQKEKRLSSKSKDIETPTTQVQVEAPLPEYDKSALLDKLIAYRERFPHLKKRNNCTIKSSADDIIDEIHYCEMQLGSRNDSNFGAVLLHGAMVVVESINRDVWNPLGLNLNGLARVTKDNMDEFQPIVDELMIKYGAGLYVGPEMRLVLALGAVMMTVHGANSGDARIAVALAKMNDTVKVPSKSKDL